LPQIEIPEKKGCVGRWWGKGIGEGFERRGESGSMSIRLGNIKQTRGVVSGIGVVALAAQVLLTEDTEQHVSTRFFFSRNLILNQCDCEDWGKRTCSSGTGEKTASGARMKRGWEPEKAKGWWGGVAASCGQGGCAALFTVGFLKGTKCLRLW